MEALVVRVGASLRVGVALLALLQAAPGAPPALPGDVDVARVILEAEGRKELPAALLDLTAAPEASIRARTALALGRIGLPDGARPLRSLILDTDASVRAAAAFALGKLELDLVPPGGESPAPTVREALATALADPDSAVVSAALWSLGFVDGGGAAVGAWLAAADPERVDARAAQLALGSWWRTRGAVDAVVRFLSAPAEGVRLAATHALRRLQSPAAIPHLASALEDPSAEVRLMALRGLDQAPPAALTARIAGLLGDHDWRVQCGAATWLGDLWARQQEESPDDRLVADVLRRSLDRNLHVRRCALRALGALADRRAVAADRLLRALESEEAAVRATAIQAMVGAEDELRRRAWETLVADGAPDLDGWLRRLADEPTVAQPLLELRASVDPDAVGMLTAVARRGTDDVAAEALRLLARRAPERTLSLAEELVRGEDPRAVARAAEVWEELVRGSSVPASPEGVELLWRRFYDGRGTAVEPARGALLAALLTADPDLMARRSVLLLGEPDRVLRLRAYRALADRPQMQEAVARGRAPLRGHGPAAGVSWDRVARRALELQERPVQVRLVAPRGEAVLELRADWAPRTVVQIVDLIAAGAYESTRFYRVIPGFVAQGGPRPLAPGAASAVPGEDSLVPAVAGTVGLALSGRDTGSTEIYVTHAAQPHLEGLYPVLGTVLEGQRTIDRIQPGDVVALRLADRPAEGRQ